MSGLAPRLVLIGAFMMTALTSSDAQKAKPARSSSPPVADGTAIIPPPTAAHKWVLPDGLTLIVKEDRSAPVASVQAWCATGSINEDEHLGAGLSHILEHMLFKGTKTQSNSVI